MSGIEGPALGVGAKLASQIFQQYVKQGEFERLCVRLSDRFSEQLPFTQADYALWAKNENFASALGRYMIPPHEFDRDALVSTITPLVGDLDQETPARALAELIADAIQGELRMAKTGDELVRFEADRLAKSLSARTYESRDPGATGQERDIFWSRAGDLSPADFGVTPLDPSFGSKFYWGPSFRRAIDAEFGSALVEGFAGESPWMIVLAGPSGAGKSRAVSDALLLGFPDVQIAIPNDAASLGRALDARVLTADIPAAGRVLLLDDLELFVAPDGLTAQRLAALKREVGPLVIVATAGGKGPRLLNELDREIRGSHMSSLRHLWDRTIRVDPTLSEKELRRTRMTPKVQEHLREHGLLWLTGAPKLQEKLQTGCHDPAAVPNPAGKSLVNLVLEWHGYGLPSGIPQDALRSLLLEREPSLDDDAFEDALRWALRPVTGDIALLHKVGEGRGARFDANDSLRQKEIWIDVDDFDIARWRQVTRFAPARQQLELLDRQRPPISPDELGFDQLREKLIEEKAGDEALATLEAVRAAILDSMLVSLWETAPEWSENEVDSNLARIDELSPAYLDAIELAAAGDHPEGLQRLARLCVPDGSREQEHYARRAFDEAARRGVLAGGHGYVDPLVTVARAQHARGELEEMDQTCRAAEAVSGQIGAEPAAETCKVLATVAGLRRDRDPLKLSASADIDWDRLAVHCVELGETALGLEFAKQGGFGGVRLEARCLAQLGHYEAAVKLLDDADEAYEMVENRCLQADILALSGRFDDQLSLLLEIFAAAKKEGSRDPLDDNSWLLPREADAGLLLEHLQGMEAAEGFYRENRDANPDYLTSLLGDLLSRTGRVREAERLIESDRYFAPCLWGRVPALDFRSLASPIASVAPWDPHFPRVEVPGYATAVRRIAAHAAKVGDARVIAMLVCDACLQAHWSEAQMLIERAKAVFPAPVPPTARDQAAIGISFAPATEYLWRAGKFLKGAGKLDAAEAVWQLCRQDGFADAMFELARSLKGREPGESDALYQDAASRFHPGALMRQ